MGWIIKRPVEIKQYCGCEDRPVWSLTQKSVADVGPGSIWECLDCQARWIVKSIIINGYFSDGRQLYTLSFEKCKARPLSKYSIELGYP